nr:MAG TPA: hypothetical protein [Herelleviridae sp.]
MKTWIIHQNIAGEDGLHYCKKHNKLVKNFRACGKCDYFFGSIQGQGVECNWEDDVPEGTPAYMTIYDPNREIARVNNLMDKGSVKKG